MRTSQKVRALAALGTLSGVVWAGTFANFSDEATASATFATGDIQLTVDDVEDLDAVTWDLSMDQMVPGSVSRAALDVENTGSLDVTYTIGAALTAGDAALASALDLRVREQGSDSACASGGNGAELSFGKLDTAAADTAAITARPLVATTGIDVLCFTVSLPNDAANALQGLTTGVAFTFTATHTP